MGDSNEMVCWFETLGLDDVPSVGGKNASLGEMIQQLEKAGVRVPGGFATTAVAYRQFLDANDLVEPITEQLALLRDEKAELSEVGKAIRKKITSGKFPDDLAEAITNAYKELSQRYDMQTADVAVRSSATAEDLPTASFAGQQETYLNVRGKDAVLKAVRKCFASLFTDRAISYREQKGFEHMEVALSAGVQKMVRSDKACAGVMFTIDTETGFPNVVVIDGAWGLGEYVVKGTVTPDEYRVFKPLLEDEECRPILERRLGDKKKKLVYKDGSDSGTKQVQLSKKDRARFVLSDDEILRLSRWAASIERHYKRPMDIEWAKDGRTDELYIVQARPETVVSQRGAAPLQNFELEEHGKAILEGSAIGHAITTGEACIVKSIKDSNQFEEGSILITTITDPDWVPLMKRASGIVTDQGGRTSHAAIVSRELGVPAIVGTRTGTSTLKNGQEITLSCAEGEVGKVYEGKLEFRVTEIDMSNIPQTKARIMLNVADPDAAMRWWSLPCDGIGLARMEFIINNIIKIHPLALLNLKEIESKKVRREIERLTEGYKDKSAYFVEHLGRGIAKIAASQYPRPVIVRLSDFKTNEYANLIGGKQFEPHEENPMLGFRGASRYYSEFYREAFRLECKAMRMAREELGFANIVAMVPFCRTLDEADRVIDVMKEDGLERGVNGFKIYVMAEIPSNIILARDFSERFDGFSIGTNDLTQLILGVDRDSSLLRHLFDERNDAIKTTIRELIAVAHASNRPVGICGQAPSDHPDFAAFLVQAGIDSISLNPDSVLKVREHLAEVEREPAKAKALA